MTRGYLYYVCSYKNNHHTGLEHNCTARSIRADKAETEAWADIERVMRNATEFERLLRKVQREEDATFEPMRAELEAIDGLLQDADHEADEIGATMRVARGRVGERIQKQMDDCNARIAELTMQRQKLITKLGERQYTDEAITELLQLGDDIRAGLDNPTFDDKRRSLELLKAKVMVTRGTVRVTIVPHLS
jgi:chromosome segregation ATPase